MQARLVPRRHSIALPLPPGCRCPTENTKCDGQVRHPLSDDNFSILQYADDTLLLVCAEITDIRRLRRILHEFTNATGLKINFSKSTMVPMNVLPSTV
jgi:hypothetical protein